MSTYVYIGYTLQTYGHTFVYIVSTFVRDANPYVDNGYMFLYIGYTLQINVYPFLYNVYIL